MYKSSTRHCANKETDKRGTLWLWHLTRNATRIERAHEEHSPDGASFPARTMTHFRKKEGGQRALPKEERKRQGSLHDRRSKTNAARLTARIMKRDLEQLGKLQSLKEKAIYLLEPQDLTKIASQQKEMPWERESFE